MNMNCEIVRDLYPDLLNGRLDSEQALNLKAHVASCDECRSEVAIIESIHARPVTLPAGLHERVIHGALRPSRRWVVTRAELAMAATLAAALIGGNAIMREQNRPVAQAPAAVVPAVHVVGNVGVEAAMLSGKSSLDDLSVEQLEKLLGEIES